MLPDAVRITIELDAKCRFTTSGSPDPAACSSICRRRAPSPALIDQTLRFDGDADIVRQVRVGRHPNNTTRVVLDAAGVTSYSVYPLYNPYRLVDRLRARAGGGDRGGDDRQGARPRRARGRATARQSTKPRAAAEPLHAAAGADDADPGCASCPALSPRSTDCSRRRRRVAAGAVRRRDRAVAAADAAAPPPAKPPPRRGDRPRRPTARPARAGAATLTGGFSMARQLGLGVSRIVIDPGHGGHDPGAQGQRRRTRPSSCSTSRCASRSCCRRCPASRSCSRAATDEFIPLPERTAIANREGADLFLSIHANASTSRQARGIETYFLNFANNLSAAAVAARENAASGQAMGALPDFVKAIALNNKLDESRDFAHARAARDGRPAAQPRTRR